MNVAIIWTDLAESNIPLDSSWRELKEGGRGVFVGMGEYACPLSEFQKPVVFSFCRCRSFNPSLRRCCYFTGSLCRCFKAMYPKQGFVYEK